MAAGASHRVDGRALAVSGSARSTGKSRRHQRVTTLAVRSRSLSVPILRPCGASHGEGASPLARHRASRPCRAAAGPVAHCHSRDGGPSSLFPRTRPPGPTSPRARPIRSTAGRLRLLKHVILHINLANPVHHQFSFPKICSGPMSMGKNKVRPFEPVCQTPCPLIHTGSKGPSPQSCNGPRAEHRCVAAKGLTHPPKSPR